eukprot:TRINITY_DN1572_c0_g1_i1.p1 TRINITY_DN1572_c0_g1~~TRINITY_DN1572_c0_g1_i1.p1  ORF type:complete len:166 (-),score=26.26 TRINITY_DN1572_c0_g1_i1:126-623(-)
MLSELKLLNIRSESESSPERTDQKSLISVYTSHIYAAHPLHAPSFWCKGQLLQCLFEVQCDPTALLHIQTNTIPHMHWPPGKQFDWHFPDNKGLELLLTDTTKVAVRGLLVRALPASLPLLYRELARDSPAADATQHSKRSPPTAALTTADLLKLLNGRLLLDKK